MLRTFTLVAVCGVVIACGGDPSRAPTRAVAPPVQPPTPPVQPTPTFVLSGTVRDEAGTALAGAIAQIVTRPYEGRTSVTNANGYFSFAGIAGIVTVRVVREGYDRYVQTLTIASDSDIDVRLTRIEVSDTIRLGRTIQSAVVTGAEPCDPIRWDATAPCRRFDFTAPRSGTLSIVITWGGDIELDAAIVRPKNVYLATSNEVPGYTLLLAAAVEANQTYEIRVNSYYYGQPFQLRADLEEAAGR